MRLSNVRAPSGMTKIAATKGAGGKGAKTEVCGAKIISAKFEADRSETWFVVRPLFICPALQNAFLTLVDIFLLLSL